MKPDTIVIDYTNWRGERRKRKIRPIGIQFGETWHHPEKQWLMWALAIDDDKPSEEVLRAFAMLNIHSIERLA